MKNGKISLVAFDMEGCLTCDPTVWEIMHRKLGSWESLGLPYWERYCAGKLEYDEFARMDVAAWRSAPVSLYDQAAREVRLMPGCDELLDALRRADIRTIIISNGLMRVAGRFVEEFGVFKAFANRAIIEDGRLTGELVIEVPYNSKGEALREFARGMGIQKDEIAAVGDSASDIAMFRESAVGIAFRPARPAVAEAATHVVNEDDLRPLAKLLLG